ncbi:hypothetical protein V6617_05925 [Pelagibacterium nitratireducens]|jgi:hypothetical protein|uniref:Uncharacterized protein n=1 Tax=Pelagibacterium nitratireducens TaxID=1046114 RepID=A0ABZ2IA97_9HYPH|nr:hypothetical protein [Pelagibacterium sp.]HCO56010.1 hypothetical protein [Pelagibacterium sp.]|tara:strand:- start:2062 stop:2277 length:216 start_codon:yes stop_codon:yes gene_type:complete
MKSYVKLASGFMLSGIGAVALERAIASGMASGNIHLPAGSGPFVSVLALAPLALIAAGVLVYVGGAVLGLK